MSALLIGGGNTAYFLTRALLAQGIRVTIVNRSPAESTRLARRLRATVVLGDGSDPRILEDAGVRRATLLLALTRHDEVNLLACQMARVLYNVRSVFALVNDPENEEIFHELGVPMTFVPTALLSALIQQRTESQAVSNIYPSLGGRVNVTEIILPEGAPVAHRAVKDIPLPRGSLLGVLFRGEVCVIPRGDTVLEVGDRLLVISLPADYARVIRVLVGNAT